jgi:steroid delta-isomerase-like uncharacterized protein
MTLTPSVPSGLADHAGPGLRAPLPFPTGTGADPRLAGAVLDAETLARRAALAAGYLEAWNAHDPQRVASFFSDDAFYDDRGAGEVARGRSGIEAHVRAVFVAFPDLTFEPRRTAHGADFMAVEWRCRMTHLGMLQGVLPTRRVVTSSGTDLGTLDAEGRIRHLVSYYDGAAIMRDLGLLPPHGSRAERLMAGAASLLGGLARIASGR